VIKRLFQRPGSLLWIVFLWKIALLAFTSQPVPSNDGFFYDGPVVNFLLHGKYANPSIALALPVSGREVFCAYPPLYQVLLLGWMSIFGTSVMAPMALHLVLFGIYLFILHKAFRLLDLPLWADYVASTFVLVITFQDRPDSLAHVLAMAAVYCWIKSRKSVPRNSSSWLWGMAVFEILSLCTGLQIGALYFMLLWIGVVAAKLFVNDRFPAGPMTALILIPAALVALVILGFPHLWTGFLEHARQTPALTGFRIPKVGEILKALRTVPGIFAIGIAVLWSGKKREIFSDANKQDLWLVALILTTASLVMAFASMFLLTANAVQFSAYLQPLAVGAYLAAMAESVSARSKSQTLMRVFIALAALGAIRAIGMTTWGVVCASDVSRTAALKRVRQEINEIHQNQSAVFSGAYLHEAAPHTDFSWIHSDWLAPARRGQVNSDRQALIKVKPVKLLLTQFDYYRRYQAVLEQLKTSSDVVTLEIIDTTRLPPPDAIKPLQKVVQHISWAPIIVNMTWKQ